VQGQSELKTLFSFSAVNLGVHSSQISLSRLLPLFLFHYSNTNHLTFFQDPFPLSESLTILNDLSMSSSNNSTSGNSTFNPYTQPITILMADGITPVTVLLSDIDASNFYNTACTINYSAQMGACFIMFFVLVILTKDSKRRTAIFVLNTLSLLFGFLRALLLAIYFVSPWVDMYPTYTFDFTFVPGSAYTTSIAGTVIPLFMTITVNLSLVLQAYTVCKSMGNNVYQYAVIGLSCVVFLLAVGFRFAEAVTNSMAITDTNTYYAQAWIQTGALATETTSIWFFSIIFTGKLLWTLRIRRAMGWKQWSGVRILAAMGGCTMIIPCKWILHAKIEDESD
jgi:pheromone alpha factor receptor